MIYHVCHSPKLDYTWLYICFSILPVDPLPMSSPPLATIGNRHSCHVARTTSRHSIRQDYGPTMEMIGLPIKKVMTWGWFEALGLPWFTTVQAASDCSGLSYIQYQWLFINRSGCLSLRTWFFSWTFGNHSSIDASCEPVQPFGVHIGQWAFQKEVCFVHPRSSTTLNPTNSRKSQVITTYHSHDMGVSRVM